MMRSKKLPASVKLVDNVLLENVAEIKDLFVGIISIVRKTFEIMSMILARKRFHNMCVLNLWKLIFLFRIEIVF